MKLQPTRKASADKSVDKHGWQAHGRQLKTLIPEAIEKR
jgi:hypothetical protein